MVVDVDKLSDAELRTKLLEFGFPVMPITGTTRKVMSKKLKMLLENKNKLGSEGGRRSLGRYSSEEESDSDIRVTTKKKENRRATMAAPLMQPPVTSPKVRKSTRFNDIVEPEITVSPVKREIRTTTTTTTNRSQKILRNAQDEFDTGSDSESDIYQSSRGGLDGRHSPLKPLSPSKYSPPKPVEHSYTTTRNISFNATPSPSRNTNLSLASEYATDRLNQIRSRLSLNSPSYDKPSYSTGTQEKEETPFLSNFTNRLSSLSSKKDYDYKNDVIKEHDVNGSSSYARSQLSNYRTTRGREPTYDYRLNRNNILKNNFVSFAVLAGAALFFVLLAIMYMGMRSDTSAISADANQQLPQLEEVLLEEESREELIQISQAEIQETTVQSNKRDYIVPQCIRNDPTSKKWVNCVPEEDVPTALHLLSVIKPELVKKAVAHKCFDPTIKPQMTESEIINFCMTNFAIKDVNQIRSDLNNLLIMTFNNPEWGLSVAQTEDNNGAVSERDLPKNMEQVIFNFDTKLTSLVILKPALPLTCKFFKSFYLIFNSVLFVVLVFGSLYLLNFGYKHYKRQQEKAKDEIGFMVEKIIDILQSSVNEDENDNFVVINHVRDMILPVGERQKKADTWEKAVKFINENESRVRTEVQEVKGEPFEVWRWIGHTNLSMSGDSSEYKYRPGRRIVDPQHLMAELHKFPHKILRFCNNSDVEIKNEVREGFHCVFVLECKKCKVRHSLCSEEEDSEYLSVNLAFVAGIISLGLSLYQLNELCSSLHIPGITADEYNQYLDEIYEIYNESVTGSESSRLTSTSKPDEDKIFGKSLDGIKQPSLSTSSQEPDKNALFKKSSEGINRPSLVTSTPKPDKDKIFKKYEPKSYAKEKFLQDLKKTPIEIEQLSKLTKDQNDSLWFAERRKRLTASNFGRVCKLLDTTNRRNIVQELLHPTFTGNIYTRWGNDNEINAIKDFERTTGMYVTRCGIFIHPKYPFLAATPDGLIDQNGLIEIKCPYKSKDVSPEVAIEQNLIKFATMVNGGLELKREDKYFYQVQGQLFVTGREYCYFVVWTPLGLVYEKIMKDEDFWDRMFPKLETFYFEHILPAALNNV